MTDYLDLGAERPNRCFLSWGSHACDLEPGHEPAVHQCRDGDYVCSEFEVTGTETGTRHTSFQEVGDPTLIKQAWTYVSGRGRYRYHDESWSPWLDGTGLYPEENRDDG